jgi:anaerobic selenocysteine-containing dehydrogenase
MGELRLQLSPDDANLRGLRDGDYAVVRSTTGELELPVAVSPALPAGVACVPKGRWPKREQQGANINALNPGGMSDMGRSTRVHGMEVTVEARPV